MVIDMFTPDSFYSSARKFARTALIANNERDFRRVAVDAATCLEHLAKACLASRSPGLLVELKNERNFSSLLQLLAIPDRDPPAYLRTVGLQDALVGVEKFVTSPASKNDLLALVEMRDGSIHAARNDEVEERVLIAFIQHVDAILRDLHRDRGTFWDDYAEVVDALLADATDKLAYRVSVKIAAARAQFQKFSQEIPYELMRLIVQFARYRFRVRSFLL